MPISFAGHVTVSPDVLFREHGEESVLLNLKTELYFGLDSVGTSMWKALQQSGSIQSAYEAILASYDVQPEQLQRDMAELLDRLVEYGLVSIGDAAETPA